MDHNTHDANDGFKSPPPKKAKFAESKDLLLDSIPAAEAEPNEEFKDEIHDAHGESAEIPFDDDAEEDAQYGEDDSYGLVDAHHEVSVIHETSGDLAMFNESNQSGWHNLVLASIKEHDIDDETLAACLHSPRQLLQEFFKLQAAVMKLRREKGILLEERELVPDDVNHLVSAYVQLRREHQLLQSEMNYKNDENAMLKASVVDLREEKVADEQEFFDCLNDMNLVHTYEVKELKAQIAAAKKAAEEAQLAAEEAQRAAEESQGAAEEAQMKLAETLQLLEEAEKKKEEVSGLTQKITELEQTLVKNKAEFEDAAKKAAAAYQVALERLKEAEKKKEAGEKEEVAALTQKVAELEQDLAKKDADLHVAQEENFRRAQHLIEIGTVVYKYGALTAINCNPADSQRKM